MITPEYGIRIEGGSRLWINGVTTAPRVATFMLNGSTTADLSAWMNGLSLAPYPGIATAINTVGAVTIGGFTSAPTGFHSFTGKIAEIVVYKRALTTSERARIETYLGGKYAIGIGA